MLLNFAAQSTFHIAIVMDGNGRWALERGLPRSEGHRRGADAVERTVTAAPRLGITDLTLFAFSSDNWKRPGEEIALLMGLFRTYLQSEAARCRDNGVALHVIGRRDRLSRDLVRAIEAAEATTRDGSRMRLRLAVDYSSRWSLAASAGSRDFRSALARVTHDDPPMPDVDLFVRTGRERRLSDFVLWESSYAELHFSDVMWPDFGEDDLARAVADFHSRSRRFGSVDAEAVSGAR